MSKGLVRGAIVLIYAVVAYVLTLVVVETDFDAGIFGVLILYGIGIGFAAQLIFDWHRTRAFLDVLGRLLMLYFLISIGFLILDAETILCIAMIFPLILGLGSAGIWLMRRLLDRFEDPPVACFGLLIVPLLVPFTDLSPLNRTETVAVTSNIVVAATPADVRTLAETVPAIDDAERPWTVTHNLLRAPRPISATTQNGVRYAQWEKGVSFEEHLLPGPDLAWRFVFPDLDAMHAVDTRISPTGPEVEMLEGRYTFVPVDGGTQVTLTTTYRLDTPINWYLKPWGRLFLTDFHTAVLDVIKARAEMDTGLL